MRIFVTFAVTLGLTVALAWLPMPGIWWHVVRWAAYLPILLVSARHGPIAGLWSGVAASLLWALATVSRGAGDVSWLSILSPDFAAVGLFGGRLLGVWPRSRQRYSVSEADAWPERGRISEPEIDLNLNPIASIQSAAGLLAEEDTPADLRHELAGIISTECGRLSAGITSLLQRTPAAVSPQFSEADLPPIIDAAVREAEFVLCGRGTVVRKEIAAELPSIQCNPDQLRNLFMSLTINAVQSAPAGDTVMLTAHRGDEGIYLDLKDQGQGSFLSGVRGRFYGARPATTGVGLAAAYDIVRRHGGKIEAKINVRKGLEFSVWLPLRRNRGNGNCAGGGGR
jgi:hypothetical protein